MILTREDVKRGTDSPSPIDATYAATAGRLVELQQLVAEKRLHIAELQEQVLQILDANRLQANRIRQLEDALVEARK